MSQARWATMRRPSQRRVHFCSSRSPSLSFREFRPVMFESRSRPFFQACPLLQGGCLLASLGAELDPGLPRLTPDVLEARAAAAIEAPRAIGRREQLAHS